jgi:pyruvate kinase
MRALIEAGMDVARLNFSHGGRAEQAGRFRSVLEAAKASGRNVATLADLQGPKIRLGTFADGPVVWQTGERVCVTVEDIPGDHDRVSTTYKDLAHDAKPGDRLLIDDGNVGLVVVSVENGVDIVCDVTEGGPVSNNKGLSLPGVAVSAPALSEKDEEDCEFALRLGVDFIALSFVRSPDDYKLVKRIMDSVGVHRPVIAKIEKPEAVERLEEIVLAFDGVMVARGDLGVELPLEQVPAVQKRIVQTCREYAKPVIVATQMLESMITHSRPTRAEASDVANAIFDGADAVMLSGETSVGQYPVQAVATMARIIVAAESGKTGGFVTAAAQPPPAARCQGRGADRTHSAPRPTSRSRRAATPHAAGALHPDARLLAFTPVEEVQRQMAPVGHRRVPHLDGQHHDEMVRQVDSRVQRRVCRPGDLVVVVAGTPPSTSGSTNTIRVHHLGDVLRHD